MEIKRELRRKIALGIVIVIGLKEFAFPLVIQYTSASIGKWLYIASLILLFYWIYNQDLG